MPRQLTLLLAMRNTFISCFACLCVLVSFSATAQDNRPLTDVRGSLSGSWYDPSRSGEGFVLEFSEISTGNVATAYWFTHRNNVPYWLIGSTEYDPMVFDKSGLIEFNLLEVSGTKFGNNFDSEDLVQIPRGTISFVFEDCKTAIASWSPEAGSAALNPEELNYNLQRITSSLDGIECGDIASQSESPWIITDKYDIPLAENARDELRTEYYELGQWNVLSARTKERFEEWRYGDQVTGPGVYMIHAHKAGIGDFNGDSTQDMLVNWVVFPTKIEGELLTPSIMLNDSGTLKLSSEIWATEPPARIFSYKVGVTDFNNDGVDDVVLGSFGSIQRLADGRDKFLHERIPLMISENGTLADYSDRIEGQETEVLPTFRWAHDLAVGDANGDGHQDFYQGWHLFIGDGKGNFKLRDDLIPQEAGILNEGFVMSSALGDLDNDGVDDLVIGLAEEQDPANARSGWIFLSDSKGDLSNARKIPLPIGRFGLLNTKHNSMTIADVTGDGLNDILIGQTKAVPYYEARHLQLLANKGDGVFVDETDLRLAEGIRPNAQGEGITTVMDINGDGHVDIVDSSGGKPSDNALLVNDGQGFFTRIPTDQLPIVQNYHLAGLADWEGFEYGNSRTLYLFPIDLDGNGIASFVVQMNIPGQFAPDDGEYDLTSLYTIKPIKPFKPQK